MTDDRTLRRAAAGLAVLVAAIHLYWAMPVLLRQLQAGLIHDPRPIAFVIASAAIVAGVTLTALGAERRPFYLGGIALMAVFLVGYAAWHTVLDHGAFWPGRPAYHHHDQGFITIMVTHLADDPIALVSKTAELALLTLLGVLYVRER